LWSNSSVTLIAFYTTFPKLSASTDP
jgi:hypothetical protein